MFAFRPRRPLLSGLLLVAFFLQGLSLLPPPSTDPVSRSSFSCLAEEPAVQVAGTEIGGETGPLAGLWTAVTGGGGFDHLLATTTLLHPQRVSGDAHRRFGDSAPALPRPPPVG